MSGSYVFIAVVAVIGVLAVAFFGRETKGQSVENVPESNVLQRSA
ncbi:MAG TPA: hypothetical protein VNG51_03220 [Ktedonobacteraceae bacterium]|nr:hypothetical protein [Ktedonobacteraceae bacterium]